MQLRPTATEVWRTAATWWGRRGARPHDFRAQAPVGSTRRVGIVSVADPGKGLWRDTQCLLWALGADLGNDEVSVFCCRGFGKLGWDLSRIASVEPPEPIASAVLGIELARWCGGVDRVVLVQAAPIPPTRSLLAAGIAVVWIPNLDWLGGDGNVDGWVQAALEFRDTYGGRFEVWAKTQGVAARLAARGIDSVVVPWSIPDPVRAERRPRTGTHVEFLFNAGMGGWRRRRGLDLAIEAFLRAVPATRTPIRLIIKSIQRCADYLPSSLHEALRHPAIRVIESFADRGTLAALHEDADAVLYPSRWEGFGLSLLEALHHGVPVLATDGDPMSELVRDGRTGLLVPARQMGWSRLAPHWECDVDGLAAAMVHFADDPELRARLTCRDAEALRERQTTFRRAVHRQLLPRASC